MKYIAAMLVLLSWLPASPSDALELRAALSSPMVNWSIYRNGAVRRTHETYDDWSVTCDEITELKQKYCSLRAVDRVNEARPMLYIDVSTGDNGAPAALIHLPLGISLSYGIALTAIDRKLDAKRAPAGKAHRLDIVDCGPTECLAVWTLNRSDIASLLDGHDMGIDMCSPGGASLVFETDLRGTSCRRKIFAEISALGFREAVQASVR